MGDVQQKELQLGPLSISSSSLLAKSSLVLRQR